MTFFVKLLTACAFFFLFSCSSEPLDKEKQLLSVIDAMEESAEQRHLSDFMQHVSEDFSDENGWGFRDVRRIIQIQIMRNKNLHIFTIIEAIQWQDDEHATVVINAALANTAIENANFLSKLRADMIKFTVQFTKQDEEFKVSSAKWTSASPDDFF